MSHYSLYTHHSLLKTTSGACVCVRAHTRTSCKLIYLNQNYIRKPKSNLSGISVSPTLSLTLHTHTRARARRERGRKLYNSLTKLVKHFNLGFLQK